MIFDSLPDEIKANLTKEYMDDPVFTEIPDLNTLLKNYKESKTYASKLRTDLDSAVRMPSKEASIEDNAKFQTDLVSKIPGLMIKPTDAQGFTDVFKSMGRPETAQEYSFPEVEGVMIDNDRKNMLTELALSNNLTKDQFSGMAKNMLEADKSFIDKQAFDASKQSDDLKTKWGVAYPDHMEKAIAAFNSASGQQTQNLNPEMAEVFYNVSEQIGTQSAQIPGQLGGNSAAVMTPQEAELRMQEALSNPDHMVNQKNHPDRQRYLETEWTQLHAYANGEQ